jgi:hypothetical protein
MGIFLVGAGLPANVTLKSYRFAGIPKGHKSPLLHIRFRVAYLLMINAGFAGKPAPTANAALKSYRFAGIP